MKQSIAWWLISILSLWAIDGVQSPALANNTDHPKLRIGYCQTGPYPNYAGTLYYLIQGLEERGWISGASALPYTWGQTHTATMWQWLVQHVQSDKIEFVPDAYYSIYLDPDAVDTMAARVEEAPDLDLMLVMGTRAGKLLAVLEHQIPTLIFSTSNAVRAGIIPSTEDSGQDHIWAHMDPDRYRRQLQVFHDIFAFKRLGIVYENSPNGRTFSAINSVEDIARERKFEIVRRFITGTADMADQPRFFHDLLARHQELAQEVDALYYAVTPMPGLKRGKLSTVLEPFYARQIPVFAQLGEEDVRQGALLSVARSDFLSVGRFGADIIIRTLEGSRPRQLPQVFGSTPSIALNFTVAKQIGFHPPFEILLVADTIYQAVEVIQDPIFD